MHGSVPFEGDKHTLEVWKIMNLTIMLKSRTGKTKNVCRVRESFMWHEMVKTVANFFTFKDVDGVMPCVML